MLISVSAVHVSVCVRLAVSLLSVLSIPVFEAEFCQRDDPAIQNVLLYNLSSALLR